MGVKFDCVFIHNDAIGSEIARSFQAAFPAAQVVTVRAEAEVKKHSRGVGRNVVYIGPRSSPFVSRFRPPRGMICAAFWKFTPETFCPLGCHYCYLNLTFRIIPYVRVASNLSQGLGELERILDREATRKHRVMFNIGELADGRLLDPITNLSRYLLPILDRHPNGMLHVLTKAGSDTIDNYIALAHLAPGRVIHVASVNPQLVIDLTEEDTPPVADRLAGLCKLQQAGYRVRLRVDPIFDLRDFGYSEQKTYKAYEELVEQIRTYCTPELITLGTYRPDPRLIPYIRRRYPDSPVLKVHTQVEGNKKRMIGRETLYRHIIHQIRESFPSVPIALCKETAEMWRRTGLEMKPLQCSCLPFANE